MAKKDYTNWDRNELIKEIDQLRKRKKYGLVWEDKPENVVEQCKTELPVLEEVKNKEIITDPDKPINLLIEGDNFHALSVLNYTHKGKIDVIYIDPPYNTGAKDWKYNNDYVDGEDPYRHTKWISFMAHRLHISKDLLAKDGIICVTIDDYEVSKLWLLMEEIFNEINFLGAIAIRINPGGRKSKRKIAAQHEYALFFSRSVNTSVASILKNPNQKSHSYKQDRNGEWYEERNLRKEGADSLAKPNSDRYYSIFYDSKTNTLSTTHKYDIEILPFDTKGEKRIWRRSKDVIDQMSATGDIFVKKTKHGEQIYFKFKGGLKGETPKSFWDDVKYSASEHGTQVLDSILGKRESFNFPKSPFATSDCIKVASNKKDAIILDFFAGSGTTGHAVLALNKEDNGNRKFILCTNNENGIAENVCLPRFKNVINGYKFTGVDRNVIFEKRLNEQILKDIDIIMLDLEQAKKDSADKYDKLEVKIEDNFLRLYGIKNFNGKKEGLGGNLKYFKTAFVPANPTDKNKTALTKKATEMLCVKEDTFEKVKSSKEYIVFGNNKRYTGIIYDHQAIDDFKKEIIKIDGKFSVYVFSLGDDTFDEEFEEMKSKVKLSPIPEAILRVYRRIFK
jgi:adenine-specific DNA-methyltransferase